jgi:hypothetical protein
MKALLRFSRWLHKTIGLALLVYLVWMSLSGIGLNHPEWTLGWEMPAWLSPAQYNHSDWNRGTLKDALELPGGDRLLAGERGIFLQKSGRQHVVEAMSGDFPAAIRLRPVHDLELIEGKIYAAGDDGLYHAAAENLQWSKLDIPENAGACNTLIEDQGELLVIHASGAFILNVQDHSTRELALPREANHQRLSMVHWVFHLHDGRVWGLAGKLLMDLAGASLIFLSFGSIWIWFFPKLVRRRKGKSIPVVGRQLFRWLLKHHLKIGIWALPVFLLLGATGFFMRPPTLLLIANRDVPRWLYPGPLPQNPWHEAIQAGLIDSAHDRLWLSADGLWSAGLARDHAGRITAVGRFTEDHLAAPIFIMGPTVFKEESPGTFLVGSYSGLFRVQPDSPEAVDALSLQQAGPINTMKPGDHMCAGLVKLGGSWWMSDHKGPPRALAHSAVRDTLSHEWGANGEPDSPEAFRQAGLSFWNWCFELHNGRLFRDWIGPFYLLVTPLGALLFVLLSFTGLIDWLRRRATRKAQS